MRTALYNGYKVHLVESVQELSFVKSLCTSNVKIGCDTETEGLDYILHSAVGVCVSCGRSYSKDDYRGFYIPMRHIGYANNLPVKDVIGFTQWVVDNFSTVWWNRSFDFTMLEKDGFVCPFVGKTHDAQCMAHLIKGESFPALKVFAKNILKFDVLEYSSNKADEGNFATTDPTTSFVYAAQDPLITALLARKIWAEYPYIQKVYPLDNKVGEAMRNFMRDALIYLDKDFLQNMLDKNLSELSAIKREIYSLVGYEFKLNSNRDKADALSRFVTLTKKTAKGAFAVNEEALSEIDHPLAKLLIKYAELEKFRGTYLEKMLKFPNPFHANYQLCNAPTGRFSSGTSKGNSYFAPINIQNIPKVEVFKYIIPDDTLGWKLSDSPEGAVGKMKCKGGMRDAFPCPEGWVWFSADYCLDPNSIVITPEGEKVLRDLHDGDLVYTPEGYKIAYNVRHTGRHKKVKITLKSGETLVCSAEHRVCIKRDGVIMWEKAGDLKSTDYVFSMNNTKYFESHGVDIREIKDNTE